MPPRVIEATIVSALFGVLAGCGGHSRPTASAPQGKPHIEVDRREIDFGFAKFGAPPLRWRPVLRNTGTAELRLLRVQKFCGCSDLVVPRSVIPPGEEIELAAEFRPGYEVGRKSAQISLLCNDEATPEVTLTATWELVPPFEVEPSAVDFGDVSASRREEQTLTVKSRDGKPLDDLQARSTHGDLSVAVESTATFAAKQLRLTLTASDATIGSGAYVRLWTSDESEAVEIPVSWSVSEGVRSIPRALFHSNARPGEILRQRVMIRSAIGPLRPALHSVEGGEGIQLERATELGSDGSTLELTWGVPTEPGPHRRTLVFRFDQEGVPEVRVPWSIFVKAPVPAASP